MVGMIPLPVIVGVRMPITVLEILIQGSWSYIHTLLLGLRLVDAVDSVE